MGKVIGWVFSISFLIAAMGLSKSFSETRNMTFLGVSILCFGCVFWLSKTTYNATKKVMMATTAILTVTGLLTWFLLDDIIENAFGLGFYYTWEAAAVMAGLPVMIYVFKHDDQ